MRIIRAIKEIWGLNVIYIVMSIIISFLFVGCFHLYNMYIYESKTNKNEIEKNKLLEWENEFLKNKFWSLQKVEERSRMIEQLRGERIKIQNEDNVLENRIINLKKQNQEDIESMSWVFNNIILE